MNKLKGPVPEVKSKTRFHSEFLVPFEKQDFSVRNKINAYSQL